MHNHIHGNTKCFKKDCVIIFEFINTELVKLKKTNGLNSFGAKYFFNNTVKLVLRKLTLWREDTL